MKIRAIPQMRCSPLTKSGMALVAACLAAQVLAQGAPSPPTDGANAASQAAPAPAPNERAVGAHPHREVRRGPVKPPHYPSNPQPPLPTRR